MSKIDDARRRRIRLGIQIANSILADPDAGTDRIIKAFTSFFGWGVLAGLAIGLPLGWWLG